ncbi:MAG: copper homeostasis protein CutC, partial [Flavobacteriales bacterium]
MIFEWCTDGFEGVGHAEELGVKRIELCGALEIGGITPAESLVKTVREEFQGEIFVMIRPRGGDFSYSIREIELMKEDIRMCARHGVEGVVFGLLTSENTIKIDSTKVLTELAHELGLKVTFHRAIDFTSDPISAFRDVKELGVDYVLSSGGEHSALEGIETLAQMAMQQSENCRL